MKVAILRAGQCLAFLDSDTHEGYLTDVEVGNNIVIRFNPTGPRRPAPTPRQPSVRFGVKGN